MSSTLGRFMRLGVSNWSLQTGLFQQRVVLPLLVLTMLTVPAGVSQTVGSAAEILKKHLLEKDYPEVFGDTHYHVRVENILSVDIDNDGKNELVVLFYPHYRQSASVMIYKLSPEGEPARVTEALAPGPLQKISGEYLDSHKTGSALDFSLPESQENPENRIKTLDIAMSHFGGVVVYRNFYHVDGRKGRTSYIDMTGVELPVNVRDCGSFEFSKVREIAAGPVREDSSKNYLAAWVGDEIYVYLIAGISGQGFLNKKLWVLKAPKDFKGFNPGQSLTYETPAGKNLLTLKN